MIQDHSSFSRLLLPYERWKKGDEIKPLGKKKKKKRFVKPTSKPENQRSTSENGQTEVAETENRVKQEPMKDEMVTSGEVVNTGIKTENVTVKSEEGGRKAEVQHRALIIKQELENMKMRKVSNLYLL